MTLQLYNSLSRKLEEFTPLEPGHVRLYTCGPTVYDYAHIGNLRTYIFEDVLRRVLERAGYNVVHVMNITDVGHLTDDADAGEDKMEVGARREGKTAVEIASFYEQAFWEDCAALNIVKPTTIAKATEYIDDQIALILRLEERGFTYRTSDGIYFDTAKFPNYGKLARLDVAGMQEGARVQKNPEKRNLTDFALWKFSENQRLSEMSQSRKPKRQMEWQSPWGVGFPGWHIECSAMSMKILGETIDIHCGGVDHLPVHHTNEIAQSEAATGKPFVRYWMHGEFLLLEHGRMGKSEGNMITLQTLRTRGLDPLSYRYFVLAAHYRAKLHFSWEALQSGQNARERLIAIMAAWDEPHIGCAEFDERFAKAVASDCNTPQALAILWELVKSDYPSAAKAASVAHMDAVLGLSLLPQAHAMKKRIDDANEDVYKLLRERDEARKQKDFVSADRLRDQLQQLGFGVEDTVDGPVLRLFSS